MCTVQAALQIAGAVVSYQQKKAENKRKLIHEIKMKFELCRVASTDLSETFSKLQDDDDDDGSGSDGDDDGQGSHDHGSQASRSPLPYDR